MSDDPKVLRAYVNATRDKAQGIVEETHHDALVREVIKDLLQLVTQYENALQNVSGQSADVRVLRKKLEQAQGSVRAAEAGMEKAKKMVLGLAEEVKLINSEAGQIAKRHESEPTHPDATSATKIRQAAQRIVELIVESR